MSFDLAAFSSSVSEFRESVALPPGPLDLNSLMQDMVQHRREMKEITRMKANMIPVGGEF
jgi:hypothetical protein